MLGKTTLPQRTGRPERVTADGYPEWLPIGVTVAWDKVTASSGTTELADGTKVYDGEKAIERGTVLVPITTQEVQTVDLSGGDDPTGGTWDLTILGETISDIAYDASAATLQTSIRALDVAHADQVTVSKAGFVYTITFPAVLGNVDAVTADGTSLTSAGSITITIATTTAGDANGGEWAPYDGSASDGRQTLTRGSVGILDMSIKDSESTVLGVDTQAELTGLITGGLVWRERLNVGEGDEPALADVLTAMPRLELTPAE